MPEGFEQGQRFLFSGGDLWPVRACGVDATPARGEGVGNAGECCRATRSFTRQGEGDAPGGGEVHRRRECPCARRRGKAYDVKDPRTHPPGRASHGGAGDRARSHQPGEAERDCPRSRASTWPARRRGTEVPARVAWWSNSAKREEQSDQDSATPSGPACRPDKPTRARPRKA